MKKVNKYFRDAYNNPIQYAKNVENWGDTKDERTIKVREQICKGIAKAQADKQKEIYKFI